VYVIVTLWIVMYAWMCGTAYYIIIFFICIRFFWYIPLCLI